MPENASSMEKALHPEVSPAAAVSKKKQWFWGVVIMVAIIDQITKWWVRTTPEIHREVLIEGMLKLHLTSNPGMAMGISWAPTWVISLVAILASGAIIWYTFSLLRVAPLGFMIAMGLIIGGAIGNILDRMYMGYVDGYGGLLSGHVVDFIYFNYIWPEWMPFVGGSVAFPYIFNMADVAISVAVIVLIGGAKWLLPQEQISKKTKPESSFDEHQVARNSVQKEPRTSASATSKQPEKQSGTEIEEAIARQQQHTSEASSGTPEKAGQQHLPSDHSLSPQKQDLLHTSDIAANIVEQVEKATEETEALKRAARSRPTDGKSDDNSATASKPKTEN